MASPDSPRALLARLDALCNAVAGPRHSRTVTPKKQDISYKIGRRRFCLAWVTEEWLAIWLPLRGHVAHDLPEFASIWGNGASIYMQVTRVTQMGEVERQLREAFKRIERITPDCR